MAIVFPGKKKRNRADIFIPRKAVLDAKEKIGLAYLDTTVLECSKNAVELTKLVNKWEEIEKERQKVIREIDREQRILVRSVRHTLSSAKQREQTSRTKSNLDLLPTKEGIETIDGKIVTPGFRYTSSGEIKPSTIAVPLCHLDSDESDDDRSSGDHSSVSSSNDYIKIDYNEEIAKLRNVIHNLCKELTNSKQRFAELSKQYKKTYIRAHSTDYVAAAAPVLQNQTPNSRFAFIPGTSERLHKPEVHTPSHRTCVGCHSRLRPSSEEFKAKRFEDSQTLLKRRWSYVPNGKYVHSSTTLKGTASTILAKSPTGSCLTTTASKKSSINIKSSNLVDFKSTTTAVNKKSSVQFRNVTVTHDRPADDSYRQRQTAHSSQRTDDTSLTRPVSSPAVLAARKSVSSAVSRPSTSLSREQSKDNRLSSRGSGAVLKRPVSSVFIDFEERLDLLKNFQVSQRHFSLWLVSSLFYINGLQLSTKS